MFDLSDTTSLASFGSPNLGDSSQSLTGHSSAPELLISLCYTSLTGRLTVEVLKATNLRYLQIQRAPGKLSLFYSNAACSVILLEASGIMNFSVFDSMLCLYFFVFFSLPSQHKLWFKKRRNLLNLNQTNYWFQIDSIVVSQIRPVWEWWAKYFQKCYPTVSANFYSLRISYLDRADLHRSNLSLVVLGVI